MTWAFLDDRAPSSDKLHDVGAEAAWYWACGLCYCREGDREQKRAPGFIPVSRAFTLFPVKNAKKTVAELVRVGLWHKVEGGYQVHNYGKVYGSKGPSAPADHQPAGPATTQPTPSQLGGKARAGSASRGPAGRFQPSQPRARQDPDPISERSNKEAAAKDLKDSAREEAAEAAAAAADSGIHKRAPWAPEIATGAVQAFVRELGDAWGQPVAVQGDQDQLVLLLVAALRNGVAPGLFGPAGRLTGEWLTGRTPDGRRRTLRMVSEDVVATSFEDAEGEAGRLAGRLIELRQSMVPRKVTPPPMTAGEILEAARAASRAADGGK